MTTWVGRARATAGRVPRPVVAVTVLFGLLLSIWSVAVPHYRAPDEPAHVDLILYLAEGNPYPDFDGRFFGKAVGLAEDRYLIDAGEPWPRFSADDVAPRGSRPDVTDLGGTAPDPRARTIDGGPRRAGAPYVYNQMPQHPPLYHQLMATGLRLERALVPGDRPPPLDREIGLLRLANVLLVLPLPLLAWAAARRTGAGDRPAILASVLTLGLPQLTHIGSSVNNDNLLTLQAGVLAVLLAGVARGRRTARTDLLVGVVLGLAVLTKAFALALVPWVVAAYVLAWLAASERRRVALGLLTAGGVTAALGAWWWIGNLVRHGEPAPTSESLTRTGDHRPGDFDPDAAAYAWRFTTRIAGRAWAWIGFGTPKVVLPGPLTATLTLVTVAAILLAIRWAAPGPDTGSGPRRRDLVLALVPVVLLVVFVARRAWGLQVSTGTFAFVQGRYLYAGLVPLLVAVAVGLHGALGRRGPVAVLTVALGLQVATLVRVLDASWAGDGLGGELGAMLAVGPWPSAAVLAAGALTVAAAVGTARLLVAEPISRR